MKLRPTICALFALLLMPLAARAQADTLLDRIWAGVQQMQNSTRTMCGNITETRTSNLIAKPMVLHGHFCSEGTLRFALDYIPPHAISVRFDTDTLTVTTGSGTESMPIGASVRRAQSSFSRENSINGLKKNFEITATENSNDYQLRFVPRSEVFRKRINYLVVKLDKQSFLPHSLEVDGKSGVNSVYAVEVTSTNQKLPAGTFQGKKTE
jgi:outer membrane lipoprotein-sorting protein